MSVAKTTILVADDQPEIRQALRLLLRREAWSVREAGSPEEVLTELGHNDVDLALLDLNYCRDTTSGREGLSLIEQVRKIDPEVPIMAMTAWGSVDIAVKALKQGASDFIEKPWENTRLMQVIRTQLEMARAQRNERRYQAIAEIQRSSPEMQGFVAESDAMQGLMRTVSRVAVADATVLLTGENGTGKGRVADLLHKLSARADKPFVTVNMGSISESLFESEMFGHERGSFTDAREARIGRFELADGGTLFLDEIGNLPESQQAKLLRVLESGEFERIGATRTQKVDVRVIAATNADLSALVDQGRFRRDLYFRLNTIEVHVPPLRQRQQDISLLAVYFLDLHGRRYGRKLSLTPPASSALLTHSWPGNVRELSHTIERAVLLAQEDQLGIEDLGLAGTTSETKHNAPILPLGESERQLIRKALEHFDGQVEAAAQALGLSRSAMYRRLQKYGIEHDPGP
jgi:DNA-binding NtrC family response regulator